MTAPGRAGASAAAPSWLERAGVLALLLAALVPRVQGITGRFDRELEGFQGTFFAGCAINYARLGLFRFAGYPALNVLLPSDPQATPFLYPNHPPLVPWLAWASLELFGPEGWETGRAPAGIEPVVRAPFFLLHMAGLLALWWAVRQGGSARLALLTLAVASFVPVSIVYAYLVNYENAYLPLLLVSCGFHARWLRRGARADLWLSAVALLLSAAFTFAPAFFVPALLLQTLVRRGWRSAARQTAVLVPAALLPALLHGAWVRARLPEVQAESVLTRARALLAPLVDSSAPPGEWCARQAARLELFFTGPLCWAAAGGLAFVAVTGLRGMRRSSGERARWRDAPVSLALPLALGGVSILVGFYRHTFDGDGPWNGQTFFLLNLVPAAAVATAHLLAGLAPALTRLRGGLAPLVVATTLLAVPALLRAGEIRREWREPGPRDDPSLASGPAAALPATYGREIAELLPPEAIGLVPRSMAFTPAVGFYAWRQLVPVSRETWGQALERIRDVLHLGDRPRFMLLPRDPPAPIRAEIEGVRADLARRFQPLAVAEHWELWPPFE